MVLMDLWRATGDLAGIGSSFYEILPFCGSSSIMSVVCMNDTILRIIYCVLVYASVNFFPY